MAVQFVFFDIGGTLGDRDAAGKLVPFPSTRNLLTKVTDPAWIGRRIGVITNLGDLTNAQGRQLLADAGLLDFLDPNGFVSERDVDGKAKPNAEIYRHAAAAVGVPIADCLFVGENLIEVIGALAAGMTALLKPCPPGRELPT